MGTGTTRAHLVELRDLERCDIGEAWALRLRPRRALGVALARCLRLSTRTKLNPVRRPQAALVMGAVELFVQEASTGGQYDYFPIFGNVYGVLRVDRKR